MLNFVTDKYKSMVDKHTISQAVKAQLQRLYGDRLDKVVLYGSYARGDFQEESDMDFLVVLKDEKIEVGKEVLKISNALSPLNLTYGVIISKYPTTIHKFTNSTFSFYKNVRREGIVL